MIELTDEEMAIANERGRIEMATKPRARAARYDRAQDRIVVDLVNGSTFSFPPQLLQGFDRATPEQIAEVEVLGVGFGLHWESLDADFTVAGLMAGRFGNARYMAERFGAAWDAVAAE
ncbi:DUF2442 domain-containing protein [Sphingomonas sp. R86521]|uniref:DUF2442 domain-containing protein n=1 Tax=Sphingomonas sp. R86521 TaxID=3093860 RepID=UPI0036D42527